MKTEADNELLAHYAHDGSEEAFRALVQRHVNLVYSAAVREVHGNSSLAEEITQEVFSEFARQAAKLVPHPALAGWLYTCVRRKSANVRRAEERRKHREQEAIAMNELLGTGPTEPLWQQVRPALDDAMHELPPEDRAAVVLRFFEGQSLKQVGAALGLTENAARMRVERSLEKLHRQLSRRGVNSTTSALAGVLGVGAVVSAPSSLAATVATGALASVASGSSAAFTFARILAMAKTKTAAAGVVVVAIVAILGVRHHSSMGPAPRPATSNLPTQASLTLVSTDSAQDTSTGSIATATNAVSSPQMALQVLEAETGKPLPATKLYLFYLLEDGRGKRVKAVTDAKGRLGVDVPQPPYRALNMFVTAEGHVPKVTSWGFRRPMPPSQYTMKLERGVAIGGTVIDQAGQPVSDARIQFDGPGNDSSLAENIQFGPDTPSVTDDNGQWSSSMIPKDYEQITLLVTHSQHAETNLSVHPGAPDANNLVITMPAGYSVKGIVQDTSGNPVEGATVRQVRLNRENERTQATDPSGGFLFRNIAAGELMLAVQTRGLAPAVQTLQVTGDVSVVRFELGPGQLLKGRVIDEAGNPLTNAFVETTRRGLDKIAWSTNTDASGRFEWDSAPPEPLLYSVLADGYSRAYAQSLVADGSEHEISLKREQPEDTVQIRGTVTDADTGQALDNFKVFVGELDSDWAFPLEFDTTGTDGQFILPLPSKSSHPGYQIQIEETGYVPAASTNLLLKQGNQVLEFKMHKGSGPSGIVQLPSGEPAANATVLLCTPVAGVTLNGPAHVEKGLNTTTYLTQTDAAGKFALAPAIDPQGIIIVHEQGYTELPPFGLVAGGIVTLQPWGRVEGKLILDSHPVSNEKIVAYNQVTRYSDAGRRFGFLTFYLETTTDSDGKFAFDKVPPGQCEVFQRLQSSYSRFNSYEARLTVKPGETSQVVLGGKGHTVLGKAILSSPTGMINWQTVPVRLRSTTGTEPGARAPQRENYSSVRAFITASENFFEAYQTQQHFGAFCSSDGSFRLTDVPAGSYELRIELRNFMLDSVTPHERGDSTPILASIIRRIEVPDDQSAESLDVGILDLIPQDSTNEATAIAH